MSNKKIFKKLYSEKINKDYNYKAILKRIENNDIKINIWKKVLVPVSSLIVVFVLILININEKENTLKLSDQIDDQNRNYEIYINNNSNTNSTTSSFSSEDIYDTIDTKKVDVNYEKLTQSSNYSFLIDLEIPDDLDNKQYKEVYVKENKNSDYNVLQNYELLYQNNSDRKIIISLSDKHEISKNESSKDNIKISKINDTEVIVYQNENSYTATFTYNDISFNIKTNNITQEELINLLTSIIK